MHSYMHSSKITKQKKIKFHAFFKKKKKKNKKKKKYNMHSSKKKKLKLHAIKQV